MARCPLCEYEGPSSSVEAHISRSEDEAHKGEVGANYRARIEGTVGETHSEPRGPRGGSSEVWGEAPEGRGGEPRAPRGEGSGGVEIEGGSGVSTSSLVIATGLLVVVVAAASLEEPVANGDPEPEADRADPAAGWSG